MPHKESVKNWRIENTFRDILYERPDRIQNERFRHLYKTFREAEDENERVPRVDGTMIYLPPSLDDAPTPKETPIPKPKIRGYHKQHSDLPSYIYSNFMKHYRTTSILTVPMMRIRKYNPYIGEWEYTDVVQKSHNAVKVKVADITSRNADMPKQENAPKTEVLGLPLMPLRITAKMSTDQAIMPPEPVSMSPMVRVVRVNPNKPVNLTAIDHNPETRVSEPKEGIPPVAETVTEFEGGIKHRWGKKGSNLTSKRGQGKKRSDNPKGVSRHRLIALFQFRKRKEAKDMESEIHG